MYSKEMSNAITDAQNVLDICNSKENVSVSIINDINRLSELIDILDTTGIKFDKKGVINKIRIEKYWERFTKYYPSVQSIIENFTIYKSIVRNTIKTLNYTIAEYISVYDYFKTINDESEEYLQQSIVALNMHSLLQNTLKEYKILQCKVDMVINTTSSTLDIAVYLASTKYKQNMMIHNSCSSGTIQEYVQGIKSLKNITKI